VLFIAAATFVEWLTYALTTALFLRIVLSYFAPPGSDNWIIRILHEVTEPVLAPLRRIVPSVGMLDLSPMVASMLLLVVGGLVRDMLLNAALRG
jgi:YggT family protein